MIKKDFAEDKCCYERNRWKERRRNFGKTIVDNVKSLPKHHLVDDNIMIQTMQTNKNGHDHRRM